MMPRTLERGRELYRQRSWGESYERLSVSDRETPLEGGDL
jgi:hypothetical protein